MLEHQEALKEWYVKGKVVLALTSYIAAASVDVVAFTDESFTTYRIYHCFKINGEWNISIRSELKVGIVVDTHDPIELVDDLAPLIQEAYWIMAGKPNEA